MTEDDKLIYDFEYDWAPVNSAMDKRIFFENKKRASLFRIIDMENQTISFSDIDRVIRITDINKVLIGEDDFDKNKKLYLPLVNKVLDDIKPIKMPYKPEELKCFIEAFPCFTDGEDDVVGVLYFKEECEDGNMLKVHKFYRKHIFGEAGNKFEEISFDDYNDLKQKWMRSMDKSE